MLDDGVETPLVEKVETKSGVRKVCVIGAGVTGIVTARILIDEGVDCTVFECTDKLAGVWAENYVGFGIQVPSNLYEFPDEPLPEGWDFCSGEMIQGYIEQYARTHGVKQHTNFNSRVSKVEANGSGYNVTYNDPKGEHTKTYDVVVVATGVYGKQDKFIPDWDGKDGFRGQIIHCADYLDINVADGKDVISVGYGKSAFDTAQVSVKVAKSSTILFRESHWCVPRKLLHIVPFEFATFSRLGGALLQPVYLVAGPFEKICHAIPTILDYFWVLVAIICKVTLGIPKSCVPDKGFIEDFWGGHGVIPHPEFFPLVNEGKITPVKGEIKTFKTKSVLLESGEELPCDVLIAATGYKPVRNFLPKAIQDLKEKDGFWLYRQMVHPAHPNMIFLNSETTTFTNITTASIQARWLVEMLAGNHHLPSKDAMQADIKSMQDWKRAKMPNAGASRAQMLQLHQVHYYDQLLKDMGASVRRKMGNPVFAALKEIFEPYRPRDYATIITGEFKHRLGETAPPGDKQAAFVKEGIIFVAFLFIICVSLRVIFNGMAVEMASKIGQSGYKWLKWIAHE